VRENNSSRYLYTNFSPCSSFHWLSHQDLYRPSCSTMNLVVHHMFQPLVVCWSQENLCIYLSTCVSIIHDFIATQLVAILLQQCWDLLHIYSIIERCCITNFSFVWRHLAVTRMENHECNTHWTFSMGSLFMCYINFQTFIPFPLPLLQIAKNKDVTQSMPWSLFSLYRWKCNKFCSAWTNHLITI